MVSYYALALAAATLAITAPVHAEGALGTGSPAVSQSNGAFSFAALQEQAEALSKAPQAPPNRVADAFFKLDYDTYRMISPRHDTMLWSDADLPFLAEFFPAGGVYEYTVEISTVDAAGKVEPLTPGARWFQYRDAAATLADRTDAGFSGLRLRTQLPGSAHKSEFAVFQGASYFRALGAGLWYGSSARGLALDIGLRNAPEEFPRFTKFWIEQPEPNSQKIRVWALLNSPAAAGAYQFTITPGNNTELDVKANVWFRHQIQKVGIAPITSMWMWNEANKPANVSRPQVHDSDTLWIQAADGDPVFRALHRPEKPEVSTFPVKSLKAFGLLQRERDYAHYKDDEAHYDIRPSVWVIPDGDWGPGRVELLELPSEHEGGDNIGAYWVSDKPVAPHDHLTLNYRVLFGKMPEGVK